MFAVGTKWERDMPGSPRDMIVAPEGRFPVRIRLGIPPGGLGQRHPQMMSWLDENCDSDGWAMTPSGLRGVLNDAISIYFADATLASPGGAPGPTSKTAGARSRCARMSRRPGLGSNCIGRPDRR